MRNHRTTTILIAVTILGLSLVTSEPGTGSEPKKPEFEVLPPELVTRAETLRERALNESDAYELLEELTTEIGPRFSGTENDRRAVAWALKKLRGLGFKNVRAEQVSVPQWLRGKATGEITSSPRLTMQPLALGGSVATPPDGMEAEVVHVVGLEELALLERSQVEGKIVFINKRMRRARDGTGYGEAAPVRRHGPARAAELGASAVLIRSVATSNTNDAHTGMTHYEEGIPKIPAASLSNREADLLANRIGKGEPVRFKLTLTCRYASDTKSANVIGEIPGSEEPNEIVLLVAHLDSWDVGTGTLDDGVGCAVIIDAASLISELTPAPRRTVRVWLAANEEFGLAGGLAYAKRYEKEANLHAAAVESDFGAGKVWGLLSRVSSESIPAARDMATLLAPIGVRYYGNETLGGADLLPMLRYRVPLFELRQDATYYFDSYHSANDTLDKVNAAELPQVVAAFAVSALVAADFEPGFGRAAEFKSKLPPPFDAIMEGRPIYR